MRKRTGILLAAVVVLAGGTAGAYTAIGIHYETRFFEKTKINGIDVSDLTAQEAEALIAEKAEDYEITIMTREREQEVIEGAAIGYRYVSEGEVQEFLDQQNIFAWLPAFVGAGYEYTVDTSMTYDQELLVQAAEALNCMQEDQITSPKDAYVEKQEDGTYAVVKEVDGNEPDREKVKQLLQETVESGGRTLDLETEDCYLSPKLFYEDSALRAEAAALNRYSSITVTYQMGGGVTIVLDSATISGWLSLDEEKQPVFDREAVASWVNQLADAYDTIGTYPPFVTSNGETVYVEARTYGWQMDREAETEALYQQLLSGESAERSPVWYESARTRDENDIGDTYVEIDYTNQRMWYYKDGVLLVETPVVTGNVSAGMASPEGIFCLVGKQEDAVLKGEDYETPVDYWMPFYGGVGIHDADSWRSTYGGDIYQWSGSHGCINTPTAQAAIIYENIEVGTPVICYSSGVNYGYSQVSGGGTSGSSGTGSGDIVIIDGGDVTFGSTGEAETVTDIGEEWTDIWPEDDWADESTYYEDGTWTEEDVVIIGEDWAGDGMFSDEQAIG